MTPAELQRLNTEHDEMRLALIVIGREGVSLERCKSIARDILARIHPVPQHEGKTR